MSQSRLRIRIFGLWIAFWIFSSLQIIMAPILRSDNAIGDEQVLSAILTVTSVWVPALSCLAAFWFPEKERQVARSRNVSRERMIPAIVLTCVYLAFVLLLIFRSVYLVNYNFGLPELPEGASFAEQLTESVKIALILSPIALAPINWLTSETAPKEKGD